MAPWLLFSVVPHLITMSNYCSVITNNTTAHATNKMNLRNSQDRLLASPIILARTNTIIKVIKVIGIPQHDYSLDYSLNECGNLHKPADVFLFGEEYQELCSHAQMQWPVSCYGDTNETFSSSSRSCRTNLVLGTYPASWMSPDNLCSSAQISIFWGQSWSSSTIIGTSLFASIQVWPGCFFTPLSFLCCSTFSWRWLLPPPA